MIMRITAVLVLAGSIVFAEKKGPLSKITFVVKNDAGQPVANVVVEGCFPSFSDPAHDGFQGYTDTNGMFVAEGDAMISVYARFNNSGYYSTTIEPNRDPRVKHRWEKGWDHDRWDVVIPVLLKRIKKPIPMYAKVVENPYLDMRRRDNRWNLEDKASYDLSMGDFLPPHGKGEIPDYEFKWKMTAPAGNKQGGVDYETLCEILMTNVVDGICKGKADGNFGGMRGSSYISAYESPTDGYTNAVSFYRNVRDNKADSNDDKHYLYYFRIRTQTNEMGQVTNALYGKIYGQINGNFTYYLNPTPNDRNLEFDPKQNLFKNLKSTGQVTTP